MDGLGPSSAGACPPSHVPQRLPPVHLTQATSAPGSASAVARVARCTSSETTTCASPPASPSHPILRTPYPQLIAPLGLRSLNLWQRARSPFCGPGRSPPQDGCGSLACVGGTSWGCAPPKDPPADPPALPAVGAVLSSTYNSNYEAEKCIDGEWPMHTMCHSSDEYSPWLEIDLGSPPRLPTHVRTPFR